MLYSFFHALYSRLQGVSIAQNSVLRCSDLICRSLSSCTRNGINHIGRRLSQEVPRSHFFVRSSPVDSLTEKGIHASPRTEMSEVTRFDHSSERVDCFNDRATIKNEVPKKKKRGRLGFCRSLAFESKDQGLSSSYTLYILYSLLLASTTLKAALVSIVAPKNKHS